MKALLTNYHQSPRKVRLIADMIRGKSVSDARTMLTFMPQKSSPAVLKLLESAVANARGKGAPAENLFVKMIAVNKGVASRRFKPMARGRAARFARTTSIISLELGTKEAAKPAKKTKSASKKAASKKQTPAT